MSTIEGVSSEHHSYQHTRQKLRFQIVRTWRSGGRFDFSDAELNAEVDRRLAAKLQNERRQYQLPLADYGAVAAETKRTACKASRQSRINRRQQITDLLEEAGSEGMTREQIAKALDCKEGYVSSPVFYLLKHGEACEPFKRKTSAGFDAGVVMLNKFATAQIETGGQQS